MKPRSLCLALVVFAALSGCGTTSEPDTVRSGDVVEATAQETYQTADPAIITATSIAASVTTAAANSETPTLPPAGANPFGGNAPEDFLMPAVVCMNLQEAQDEIQDHGVFLSRSEDATGQGRNQINDSNWQVVGQSPEQGTPIGEGEAVLYVVKYGEQSDLC